MAKKKFYAVKSQMTKKIYSTWDECKLMVQGVSGAQFKGFSSQVEAQAWLDEAAEALTEGFRIYVDGSYQPSKSTRSGWGIVVLKDEKVIFEDYGVTKGDALSRNIDGELRASLEAMKWAYLNQIKITLVYDYEGIARWALGDWKSKSEIAKLYVQASKDWVHLVKFEKVAAHSGNVWNEYADKLAKKGVIEFAAVAEKQNQSKDSV